MKCLFLWFPITVIHRPVYTLFILQYPNSKPWSRETKTKSGLEWTGELFENFLWPWSQDLGSERLKWQTPLRTRRSRMFRGTTEGILRFRLQELLFLHEFLSRTLPLFCKFLLFVTPYFTKIKDLCVVNCYLFTFDLPSDLGLYCLDGKVKLYHL